MLSFIYKDGLATFFNQSGVFSSLFFLYPPFSSSQESARCVERKFWTPRTTNRHQCDSVTIRGQFCEWTSDVKMRLMVHVILSHFQYLSISSCHWRLELLTVHPPHLCESERFWGGFALLLYTIITNNATGTVAVNREALLSLNTPPVITCFADFLYILNSILWLDSLLFRFWFLYVCMYFLSE